MNEEKALTDNVTETVRIELTKELIEEFIQNLDLRGMAQVTQKSYKRWISRLYDELPDGKLLTDENVTAARDRLCERGISSMNKAQLLAAMTRLQTYLMQRGDEAPVMPMRPTITRPEYLRLLSGARLQNAEVAYLLIKIFANTGIPPKYISKLTVDNIRSGRSTNGDEMVTIPKSLCDELLRYAELKGIKSGAVIQTKKGIPMGATRISAEILSVAAFCRVSEAKATPQSLCRLYEATSANILDSVRVIYNQNYERMLMTEELTVGWKRESV